MHRQIFFWPRPLGPWRGIKRSNIILFQLCSRDGTWGCLGAKIKFCPAVCPLCYLLNHWTKFKQIWCVSYTYEWGVKQQFIFGPAPWGLGEGSKGQISFNFNYKVNFKDFIPNFVCVLTNERYKTYQMGFSFCCLGHAPGVELWGAGGAQVAKNLFFSNMVMWHIKSTRMISGTECK